MKTMSRVICGLALLCGMPLAHAVNRNSNIVVETPAALPEAAQSHSEDLLLHADGAGHTYLYLEQHKGARLVVLNVTNPAHVMVAASVTTGAAGTWNFVRPINDSLELIDYRDGSGYALLNLRSAKAPRLMHTGAVALEPSEMLGNNGYLAFASSDKPEVTRPSVRNVQVVATNGAPRLLAVVQQVTLRTTRPATGTTFLIGSQGLTIIRQLDVERQYAAEQLAMSHN